MSASTDIRDYLVPFIGKSIGATINDTDTFHLRGAVNAALMDLLMDRLAETRSELVRAPASVTIGAVTNNSKTITFAGYQSYMLGCSILVGDEWNRLVKPGASVELETAYAGTTASNVAATVYFDAITLSYLIDSPQDPVLLSDQWRVQMVPNRVVWQNLRMWGSQPPIPPFGAPQHALMEDVITVDGTPVSQFLFTSLPMVQYNLSYTAALRPTQIADWTTNTQPYFLPGGRDVQVLRPVALYYLSKYPVFIGDRGEVEKDYAQAKLQWGVFTNKGSQPGVLDYFGC